MTMTRGLESNISDFTDLEQKLIVEVSNKLENNGYPLNQLTRIDLKKRIVDAADYYTYNEIIFFINPGIYSRGGFNIGMVNIGIDWDDPSDIRTPDGGIEFEMGKITKDEDLVMFLYRLDDSYSAIPLLENHDLILEKIDDVLATSTLEEIKPLTSVGINSLIKNYIIHFSADNKNEMIYVMSIGRIDYDLIDFNYFYDEFRQYHLKINLQTRTIEIISSFDPTFFPTPTSLPEQPTIKKAL